MFGLKLGHQLRKSESVVGGNYQDCLSGSFDSVLQRGLGDMLSSLNLHVCPY